MKLGQRWFSKNKMAEGSSAQSLQFSGGEKEVIERKLDVSIDGLATRKDISDFYEISRCVNVIKNRGFEKVNSNFHNSTSSSTGIIKTLQDKKNIIHLFRFICFLTVNFLCLCNHFVNNLYELGHSIFIIRSPPPPHCILGTRKSVSVPLIFFNKL